VQMYIFIIIQKEYKLSFFNSSDVFTDLLFFFLQYRIVNNSLYKKKKNKHPKKLTFNSITVTMQDRF
jgi:hypothetical protein